MLVTVGAGAGGAVVVVLGTVGELIERVGAPVVCHVVWVVGVAPGEGTTVRVVTVTVSCGDGWETCVEPAVVRAPVAVCEVGDGAGVGAVLVAEYVVAGVVCATVGVLVDGDAPAWWPAAWCALWWA